MRTVVEVCATVDIRLLTNVQCYGIPEAAMDEIHVMTFCRQYLSTWANDGMHQQEAQIDSTLDVDFVDVFTCDVPRRRNVRFQ